ncbi:MAG TPA: ABC transporter ATP-binding protein [Candidatus Blautia pullicola]|uniref:ABC transporter ATP-binding protein n=1 Tax=Candidatus Blautia pullicola TaxID=2838498 RepID=A0A9D2FPT2_9FIRM|nr:ABC transporter ATP-binding protein [Candidatus Blautia pullicola]
MNCLTARNISYTYQSKYQKVEALKEVSCTFERGKLYGIIGHSGSGKTTLVSLLAGLGTPDKGVILADGEDIGQIGYERHRRENVSVIYQSFHLFPTLTLLENVMYPMEIVKTPRKEAKARAEALLESVGLTRKLQGKFPAMLSGGEQQRGAIARALAGKAETILGDEPTGNLDSENGKIVMDILESLVREKNFCVVVVTHDREIAARADMVYEMRDGRIVKVYEKH